MNQRELRRPRRSLRAAAAAVVVCLLASGLLGGPAGAQTDDEASTDDGASEEMPAPEPAPEPAPRVSEDPWADPVLRWPDPLAESQLGTEPTYYWFARDDRRSLLPSATSERPLRVWAGGDSMSGGPVYGFRQLIADDERFRFTEDIIKSTGVVTDWYFDWIDYMATEVAEGPYDVIVIAMGANDKQRFRGIPVYVGEQAWSEQYRSRVRDIVAAAVRPGRLVVWVGLPPLGTRFLSDLPSTVNPLAAAAVAEVPEAIFVDAYETLSVDGRYASQLGADHGNRRIRTQDGVHYTLYGGVVLTEPILAEIERRSG